MQEINLNLSNDNFSKIQQDYGDGTKNFEFLNKDYDHIYGNQIININSNQKPTQVNLTLKPNSGAPKGVTNSAQNTNSIIGTKTKRSTLKESDSHIKNTTKIFVVTRIKQQTHNDNYRKTVLKAPYNSFIELVEIYSGIRNRHEKLLTINLNKVFGGIEKNKSVLRGSLREIIYKEKKNETLLNESTPINETYSNYFLNQSYEFLLHKFYSNDKFFEINGLEVPFNEYKNFEDIKEEKDCYSSKEFQREKKNVLNGFKDLKGRRRKRKIFRVARDNEKKVVETKKNNYLMRMSRKSRKNHS